MKPDLRRWLIAILGAGLPIPYALPWPGSQGSIAAGLLIWAVLVPILLITGPKEWTLLRRDVVGRLLLVFLFVSALSLPIGLVLTHNSNGPRSYVYQVALMLNFGVGYLILRRLDDIDLFFRTFVATIGVISIPLSIGLLQAGILYDVHWFHNSTDLRTTIYGWPNGFSILVVVAMVMCLRIISTATTRLVRWAYVVLAIGLSACLTLTFSKTGWVALAVALWLLALRKWSVWRQVLLLAGAAATLFVLERVNGSFRDTVFTLGTLEERLRFLVLVLHRIKPILLLTGSGSQSLETLLARFASEQLEPGLSVGGLSAHDEFLNVLVKSGLFGLILFGAALVIVMWRTRRVAMSTDSRIAHIFRSWYAASWAVIVSLFAIDELHYWPVGALFWMMAGATVHLLTHTEPRTDLVAAPHPEIDATPAGGQSSRSP